MARKNSYVPKDRRTQFGAFLTAAQLGFFYSDRLGTYVRISWENGKPQEVHDETECSISVEFCPWEYINDRVSLGKIPYVRWRDDSGDRNLISLLNLEGVSFNSYHRIIFDGNGNQK